MGQLVNHSYLKLEGRINPEDIQRDEGIGKIQGKPIHQSGAFLESDQGEALHGESWVCGIGRQKMGLKRRRKSARYSQVDILKIKFLCLLLDPFQSKTLDCYHEHQVVIISSFVQCKPN